MALFCICVAAILITITVPVFCEEIEFDANLQDGRRLVYNFNSSNFENCLFSQTENKAICMVKENFKTVVDEWKYQSTKIYYISVNCMKQTFYSTQSHICVCVNGSDAANPGKYKQHDVIHYCHLTKIGEGMFAKLSHLRVLDLSSNGIHTLEENSFAGLTSLEYLDISNNPIRSLSEKFLCDMPMLQTLKMANISLDSKTFHKRPFDCTETLKEMVYIDLSGNKIENIPHQLCDKLPSIRTLILRNNIINHISASAFIGSSKLRYLDISLNHLPIVPVTFCNFLPEIRFINMSSNHITKLKIEDISKCSVTEVFDLSLNMIQTITGSLLQPSNLRTMNFSGNGLHTISDGFLQSATNLTELDLSLNSLELLYISNFKGLKILKDLKLNGNKFNDTKHLLNVFDITRNVLSLNLSSNNIGNIANNSFAALTKLKKLDLSLNNISYIYSDSFTGLSSLKTLHLHHNKIESINQTSLSTLLSLENIDLSHNMLNNVIDNVSMPVSITHGNLEGNMISEFPTCFNSTKIRVLNLKSNIIETMIRHRQNILRSLELLDLSYNQLHSFDNVSFANMYELSNLDLSFNVLYGSLYGETFRGTEKLAVLNLKKNYINNIDDFFSDSWTSTIIDLDLSYNAIESIDSLILRSYIFDLKNQPTYNLRELNLKHNFIHSISQYAFQGLSHLRQVNLKENMLQTVFPFVVEYKTEFLLQDNPLVCDCHMTWLAESYITINNQTISTFDFEVDTCVVRPENIKLPVRKVPEDHFRCQVDAGCDSICKCFTSNNESSIDFVICHGVIGVLPTILSRTAKVIYLDGNRFPVLSFPNHYSPDFLTTELYLNRSQIGIIQDIFFSGFGEVEHLDLSGNVLKTLPEQIFNNLLKLKSLYLSDNKIEAVSASWFEGLSLLKNLYLNGNKIKYISPTVLSVLDATHSLRYLHLEENPYMCNCQNRAFRIWLKKYGKIVRSRYDLQCFDTDNAILETPISAFFCSSSQTYYKTEVIIAVIVSSVCAIAVLSAIIYYRRDLLAVLYVKLGVGCWRQKFEINKPYDAYLVYDANDSKCSDWVNLSLLKFLEKRKNPYKIATTDRTKLLPNATDINNTQLLESKTCIFILNTSVMSNSWCVENFHRAWALGRKDRNFKTILIVFGDIELHLLEEEMRVMLSNGQYITARSHSVWDRIVYELPNPEIGFDSVRCEDDVSENDVIIYSATGNNMDEYGSVSIH